MVLQEPLLFQGTVYQNVAAGLRIRGLPRREERRRVMAWLERFVAVHPLTLARMQRKHEYVDLRYPNGFALRVPELEGG